MYLTGFLRVAETTMFNLISLKIIINIDYTEKKAPNRVIKFKELYSNFCLPPPPHIL